MFYFLSLNQNIMPGSCALIKNKKPSIGHNVSHSNVKTRKKFHINTQKSTLDLNGRKVVLNLANSTKRTIRKFGESLSNFLLNISNRKLTTKGLKLKREVLKKNPSIKIEEFKPKNPKILALKKQPKARILKKLAAKNTAKEKIGE